MKTKLTNSQFVKRKTVIHRARVILEKAWSGVAFESDATTESLLRQAASLCLELADKLKGRGK